MLIKNIVFYGAYAGSLLMFFIVLDSGDVFPENNGIDYYTDRQFSTETKGNFGAGGTQANIEKNNDGNSGKSYYLTGVEAVNKGNYERAATLFNHAVKDNDNVIDSHYRLANIYRFFLKNEELARLHIDKYIELMNAKYNNYDFLSKMYDFDNDSTANERDNYSMAIDFFKTGMMMAGKGSTAQARDELKKALVYYQKDPHIYYNLAVLEHKLENIDGAVQNYKKSLELNPENEQALFGLGTAYQIKGNEILAAQYYTKTIELNPKNIPAINNLAVLYENAGMVDKAIEKYLSIISITPKYSRAYNNLGTILARRGDINSAEKYFHQAIKANPQYLAPRYNLAVIYENKNMSQKALEEYRFISLKDPQYPGVADKILYIEQSMGLAGNESGGLNLSSNSSNADKFSKNNDNMLSTLNIKKQPEPKTGMVESNQKSAVVFNSFDRKINKNPKSETVYREIAGYFIGVKDYDNAIKYLNEGIKNTKGNIGLRYVLADTLAKRKYYFKAIKEYESILKSNPREHEANYRLSLIYSDKENPLKDSAKALYFYKKTKNSSDETSSKNKTLNSGKTNLKSVSRGKY